MPTVKRSLALLQARGRISRKPGPAAVTTKYRLHLAPPSDPGHTDPGRTDPGHTGTQGGHQDDQHPGSEGATNQEDNPGKQAAPETETERPTHAEAAAAAAIELIILHKLKSTRGEPGAHRAFLARTLPNEHADAIADYLAEHPDAAAEELAAALMPALASEHQHERRPAWYYDPACTEHDTDGLVRIDDTGQGTYRPCPCRRAEPYPELAA